jgi:hypothetical protein
MRPIDARLKQLANLQRMLVDNEQILCDAVYKDIRRVREAARTRAHHCA